MSSFYKKKVKISDPIFLSLFEVRVIYTEVDIFFHHAKDIYARTDIQS